VSAAGDQSAAAARTGVAVVTDTTTYLPPELIDRWAIQQVSLYAGWDGDLRRESEYTDLDAFYRRLKESPSLPATSQPSVGDFVACFEPLVSAGRDVVSIHIAEGLSGTCDSAREAARTLADAGHPGSIQVLDAQTDAGGLGCVVLAAARAAADGAPADQVVAAAKGTRERLHMWFCLDTLEYLKKGGRIGGAQAMVGTALKVKPILTFGAEITPVGRVRTHRRAMERMVANLHELHDLGVEEWIVQHAQAHDDADMLVAEGTAILSGPPLFCTEVGPVLGAHLGSGVLVGGIARDAGPPGTA
jgi:DegV family protein with EDD domain